MVWESLKTVVLTESGGFVMEGIAYERHSADLLGDPDCPMHRVEKQIASVASAHIPLIDSQPAKQRRR